ncbi:JAB domain-containing protein [Chitinophaga sp.]|uniref:JAB domain-containing protein n=1 Tax=Chitinophaga sp. TaxID=1869181 RepID=UPI00260FCF8B|nr:JAB domain-containing protein [uncultured Chitinophaga sp.]
MPVFTAAQGAERPGMGQMGALILQLQLFTNKFACDQRKIWVIGMSRDEEVLFTELIHVADRERPFPPATPVFWQAVQKRSAGLILAKSGIKGIPGPEEGDVRFMERMSAAGVKKGCPLLDYLMVGGDSWYSMNAQRLFMVA